MSAKWLTLEEIVTKSTTAEFVHLYTDMGENATTGNGTMGTMEPATMATGSENQNGGGDGGVRTDASSVLTTCYIIIGSVGIVGE